MNTPSIKFKKMLCSNSKMDRDRILYDISNWLISQASIDPQASACQHNIQQLHYNNSRYDDKTFKNDIHWNVFVSFNTCVSFQEIVKAKLGIPQTNIANTIKKPDVEPRKAIPKKLRGEVWKNHCGDSTKGLCYCCSTELDIFDVWHAGHIISHAYGGTNTVENLRPICSSCNLSMGTENMDEFKARCYPSLA